MVNYRGSTGYGQAFSDAIARDQNGGEAQDVLSGVDAALQPIRGSIRSRSASRAELRRPADELARDADGRFKAAIPAASISNLVSHNYMSVYHDYLRAGVRRLARTWAAIVDMLWERSAIRIRERVEHADDAHPRRQRSAVNPAEIEAVLHRPQGRRHRNADGALSARRSRHAREPAHRRHHRAIDRLV